MVITFSSLFFWVLGLEYPILTGIVSGLLNMVPYIGAVLAWLPAFMMALCQVADVSAGSADRRSTDRHSHVRAEFDGAAAGWAAFALNAVAITDFAAFLGLGVGRHGIAAGHSDYGYVACDLRSHGILEADWPLAQRVNPLQDRADSINGR